MIKAKKKNKEKMNVTTIKFGKNKCYKNKILGKKNKKTEHL